MTLMIKPFFTINGISILCEQIEKHCIPRLAMEPKDWKRIGGSEFKSVHVDVISRRFDASDFHNYENSLFECPLFHLFILRENEKIYIEANKDLFGQWIGTLRSRSLKNWNVLILPNDDNSTKAKFTLTKFNIINRLKNDFNIHDLEKITERVGDESEAVEHIQNFLRNAVLYYYDLKCFRNEEKIRNQREMMYTNQWNYFEYFVLQEECADVYECLNLYDEALAQFEEAGSLFSKCIYNFRKENAEWLQELKKVPFKKIDSLILTNFADPKKRKQLINKSMCLSDFHAYLLSRQCALLQMLNRYREIPKKVYDTLLEYLAQVKLLDLDIDVNLKNIWIYLTAMQALQRFNASDDQDNVAQSYASLLRLALTSINGLAHSLNIWIADDDQHQRIDWTAVEALRNTIVVLDDKDFGNTPSSQLNVAMTCRDKFREFHINLWEETIMIWKHVQRIRSANFLGAQLADLFFKVGEYEKAEPFYIKAIKCLRNENWSHLAMPLRLKLAVCQKHQFQSNPIKYLKTCVHLAGATFNSNSTDFLNQDTPLMTTEQHIIYYNELKQCINQLYLDTSVPVNFHLEPLFRLDNVELVRHSNPHRRQSIQIELHSFLPQTMHVKILVRAIAYGEVDLSEQLYLQDYSDTVPISSTDTTSPDYESGELIDCSINSEDPINNSITSAKSALTEIKNISTTHGAGQLKMSSSFDLPLNIKYRDVIQVKSTYRNNDKQNHKVSIVCLPKLDAGLKLRKVSLSQDATVQDTSALLHKVLNNQSEVESANAQLYSTEFIVDQSDLNATVQINTGRNIFTLIAKDFGLFRPDLIEVDIFNGQAKCVEEIDDEKLDSTWTDKTVLSELLPSFSINEREQISYVNFSNKITPKITCGKICMIIPNNIKSVEVVVKNSSNNIVNRRSVGLQSDCDENDRQIMKPTMPLEYIVASQNDRVFIRLPGLVIRECTNITSEDNKDSGAALKIVDNLQIQERIIPMNNGNYLVAVELNALSQLPDDDANPHSLCNYEIKQTALKFHHRNDVVQLLNLVHNNMSNFKISEYSNLVLLWLLEAIDLKNNDDYQLEFTLSLDLVLQKGQVNADDDGQQQQRSNSMSLFGHLCRQFQLDYLSSV